jgi:hypothetical protein
MSENDGDSDTVTDADPDTGSVEPFPADRWSGEDVAPIEVFVPLDRFESHPD